MRLVSLACPPLPVVAQLAGAFDAWGWCASDEVDWRLPNDVTQIDTTAEHSRVDGDNPPELLFVVRRSSTEGGASIDLPQELARLHLRGYGFEEETALAPWAIDDATDGFFAARSRPRDTLWLAAPTLRALVWGLHDWVHFHNHGPFDDPARTELQCDLVALAWLRLNQRRIGIDDATVAGVTRDLVALSRRRFSPDPPPVDIADLFARYPAV